MNKHYSDPRGALTTTRGLRQQAMTQSKELLEKAYAPVSDFASVLAEHRCVRLNKLDSATEDFLAHMRLKLAEQD
jgi:hypothetical protein